MITYIAFGSRGDVLPLLTLSLSLPFPSTLITHSVHKSWIDITLPPTYSCDIIYVDSSTSEITPSSLLLNVVPKTTKLTIHTLFSLEAFHISEKINVKSLIIQPHQLPEKHVRDGDWTYILTSQRWYEYRVELGLNSDYTDRDIDIKIVYCLPPQLTTLPPSLCTGYIDSEIMRANIPMNEEIDEFIKSSEQKIISKIILVTFGSMSGIEGAIPEGFLGKLVNDLEVRKED